MDIFGIALTSALALAAWFAVAVAVALPVGAIVRRRDAQPAPSTEFDIDARNFFTQQGVRL
jgi:hypothetical protein